MTLLGSADWTGKIFGGTWTAAQGGTLASTEPATGQMLAEVGLANKGDVAAAAEQAKAAQPGWAATPGHERAALLRRYCPWCGIPARSGVDQAGPRTTSRRRA